MVLANYAEDNGGLLYIAGATWDTIAVRAPISPVPGGPVAIIQGSLVIRLLLHVNETDQDYKFTAMLLDEDGGQAAAVQGSMRVAKSPNLPTGWDQGVNLVIPLSGIPLSKFGRYEIALQVDKNVLGTLPFRVQKSY